MECSIMHTNFCITWYVVHALEYMCSHRHEQGMTNIAYTIMNTLGESSDGGGRGRFEWNSLRVIISLCCLGISTRQALLRFIVF